MVKIWRRREKETLKEGEDPDPICISWKNIMIVVLYKLKLYLNLKNIKKKENK
jgi:hypothetical protein